MEGIGAGNGASAATLDQWRQYSRLFQYYLDKTTPHTTYRWIGTATLAFLFVLRVVYVQGFYIVTYGLGIYILNLLIGFLSPLVDPEVDSTDGPMLPTKGSDEFKPFIRRLPEFKFWYAITKAFIISILMTFFSMFDVPVFWPILLCYWFVLFALTMKRQIMHMIKYKYIPFSLGKQMTRQKQLEKINIPPRRLVKLLRKKTCLFISAKKVSINYGMQVGVMVFAQSGKYHEYVSDRFVMRDIVTRYRRSETSILSSGNDHIEDLLKYAEEVSVLGDAQVGVIVFLHGGDLVHFPSDTSRFMEIVERWERLHEEKSTPSYVKFGFYFIFLTLTLLFFYYVL